MKFFDIFKKKDNIRKNECEQERKLEIINEEEVIISEPKKFEDYIKARISNDLNFDSENALMNQFGIAEYITSVEYTTLETAAEMGWIMADKPEISFKFSKFYFENCHSKYEKDMTHEFFHAKLLVDTYKKHGKTCCDKLYKVTLHNYNGIWDKAAYYAIVEFYAYYKNAIEFHDIEIAENMNNIISTFNYIINSKNNACILDLFYKVAAVAAIETAGVKTNYYQKEPKIIDMVMNTKDLLYKQYLEQEKNGSFDYDDYAKFGNELEIIFNTAAH